MQESSQKNTSELDLKKEVAFLTAELERVNGLLLLLKRGKFTPGSERVVDLPPTTQDVMVFNEIEQAASQLDLPPVTETITYQRQKSQGRCAKKPFPENLPREEQIIDLPESEKVCPHDGTALKLMGEERTEKLKAVPAQMSVVVQIKKKYACAHCDAHVAQGKSHSILPGTIATPELLSFLVYSKFFQGLPLYRLEEQFKLSKIELTRGTMARWLVKVTEQLVPIYNLLQDQAFDSGYMAIDATHVQVLKEPGRKAEAKSFMWVRGSPERGIVLFDYDVSGGGKVAEKLVTEFKGALQADAHRGYRILNPQQVNLLGCMMHSRRRFHKAWLLGKKQPGLASEALAKFKLLYRFEKDYKKRGLTPDERKEVREKEVKPWLESMKQWCESNISKVPKSSPIGNALNYFFAEYTELSAFLANGRYEVDNGWVERAIRKFGIGRNNWMFCDTVAGAHASSMLYSLAITAKLNGKDPFLVMTEIFRDLPKAETAEDYERLTALLLSPVNPLSCHKKEG